MKKSLKSIALLFSASLVLAACGQKENSNSKENSSEATATTVTPTTATPTTVDALADAKKTVLEAGDEAAKGTMTLYYKDDVLLKQETVTTYIVSKMEGEKPLEALQNSSARAEEKYKDLMGKGFEFKTDYKDGIFTINNTIDYTKIDLKKLKEIHPNLQLRDDNTISYSQFKENLVKGGYKEK